MRVLLVFPQRDQRTGLYILNAIKLCGCIVEVIDPKVHPLSVVDMSTKFEPNLLLCSRTAQIADGIEYISRNNRSIVTACWNTDIRDNIKEFGNDIVRVFKSVDLMYTVGLGRIEEYIKLRGGLHAGWLPQGIDPSFQKKETISDEERVRYTCDVMFAGNTTWPIHKGRKEWIDAIRRAGIDIKVYGDGSNYLRNRDHNIACQCAKISLGRSVFTNVSAGVSVRDVQTMGGNGFLLTNNVKDIDKLFEVGKECIVYNSDQECVNLIFSYLKHPDKREEIREIGYIAAHTRHTYKQRVEQIIRDYTKVMEAKCI